jgi:hypothetical protein
MRAHRPIDFAEVNRAAHSDIRGVLARFLPGGKVIQNEYVALNPHRADRHFGSFRINLRTGKWADFASCDCGGDLISLVAFVDNVSQLDAALLLARMLGVKIKERSR